MINLLVAVLLHDLKGFSSRNACRVTELLAVPFVLSLQGFLRSIFLLFLPVSFGCLFLGVASLPTEAFSMDMVACKSWRGWSISIFNYLGVECFCMGQVILHPLPYFTIPFLK